MNPRNLINRASPLAAWLAIVLCVTVLAGCLGQHARTIAADTITTDANEAATYAEAAPNNDAQAVADFRKAVAAKDWATASIVWSRVRPDADRGIDAETDTGPAAKSLGHEQIKQFDANLARLAGSNP